MPDTLTEREFVKSITLGQPAARIVVVVVDIWQESNGELKQDVAMLPVVSAETAVVWHWLRDDGRHDRHEYVTTSDLRSAGFSFVGEEIRRELIVFYPKWNFGSLVSVDELWRQPDLGVRAVVCSWPPSEDESRLAPIIDELIEQQKREVSRG